MTDPFHTHSRIGWMRLLAEQNTAPISEADRIWAMFRLGLYISVAQTPAYENDWRIAFAKTVSHALLGDEERSHHFLSQCLAAPEAEAHRIRLAVILAPYQPNVALQLIQDHPRVYPSVQLALMLNAGLSEQAPEQFSTLSTEAFEKWPELYLLQTNTCGGTTNEQMIRLNAFWNAVGLAPMRLSDESLPPSPTNLVSCNSDFVEDGPLVSVLMTTYRTGTRTRAAIASVLAQSWRNLELIVVDDASGDATIDHVYQMATEDDRIRVIPLTRNVGTYAAKLIGLRYAKGEFITCHDADDWSHPEKIARQIAPLLADTHLIATESDWVRMRDDGTFYSYLVTPLIGNNSSSLLFRRELVLREAGAWNALRIGADAEFAARLRIVFGEAAIQHIDLPLALGGYRNDSLEHSPHTGFPKKAGGSLLRQQYWETFVQWHIAMISRGMSPFISPDPTQSIREAPFEVDSTIKINIRDLDACLAELSKPKHDMA